MPPELVGLIREGGTIAVAGVFAVLWWLERGERKELLKTKDAIIERVINALNNSSNSIGDLRVYLGLNRHDQGRKE